MEQLAARAEQETTDKNRRPLDVFQSWFQTLDTPPVVWLGDHDAVNDAVWAAFLTRFTDMVSMHVADRSTHALDEGVPDGWSNDRLVAEMQASWRNGD